MKHRVLLLALALLLASNPVRAFQAGPAPAKSTTPENVSAPRAIEMKDALAWKRTAAPAVSNDGQYFAYKLTPNEGDSELVVRRLKDGKEWRFPLGEAPLMAGFAFADNNAARDVAFSDDNRWLAFTVYPNFKDAKRLKKERKPLHNKVTLLELTTEKKTEFEKVRRFAFNGAHGGWLALHKYGAEPSGAGPTPPPSATSGSSTPAPERPTGADLIIYELAAGNQLNFGNVADFAFNKKGDRLAWTIDAQDKAGNGVQLRDMTTGAVLPLDSDKANYKGLNWTEQGEGLAIVKGVEDKAYEDKLYSVVGFNFTAAAAAQKTVYDPRQDAAFPAGLTISPNRNPTWTEDMRALLFGIHEINKKKGGQASEGDAKPAAAIKKPDDEPERPDLVLWHWKDGRLQAQQQVEEGRDKIFSYLAIYRVPEKKFLRLADGELRNVIAAPKQKYAIGLDNRSYELLSNLDGRRYQDIYVIDLQTGTRKLAVKQNRWYGGPSPDGAQFLYYDDGHYFAYDMATGQSHNLTKNVATSFINDEDDHNITKPPTGIVGWTKDGASVLLSDNWDIWNVPVRSGKAVNLTGNGKQEKIRYRNRFRLDPEEKGIDLTKPIYVSAYGEWTKKAGIGRIESTKPGVKMLAWDTAAYGNLLKAKAADVYLFTRETYQDSPDYYLADAMLGNNQKITNLNPQQKDYLWSSGAKLLDYTSDKGDKLQAALHLPTNYQPGKSYPTVVYIYERLSQGLNAYTAPSATGFNKSLYTSHGYAVLMPDIKYRVNDPGMSTVWCVLPALKAAIASGVVDKDRVGLHGHSWGGYQTAFLITQTDAFKAAIAGAPLTDMISMYNLIYWNTGSGNMSIFESSQGRFTGSPVDDAASYIRNSPLYHAKNVKTPLMILHNDKDGAVDFTQGIEYFNQLRRLQKPVVMLQYKGENHGLRVPANQKDYFVRMKEFFDHHLRDQPAPKWLLEGVPHLKLKDHLEERIKPKVEAEAAPLNEARR